MNIVLATRNRKKIEEMKRMFVGHKITFKTLDAFPGCPEVNEDGKTFRANALKKARAVAKFTGCPALADDSGLEVEALDRAPGVFSARYAGDGANDRKNLNKVLRELRHVREENRKARFVCCIAFALPDGNAKTFTGYINGNILKSSKGSNGFGYDPVFRPEGNKKTFAEMSGDEKDLLSHRGRALKKFHDYLVKVR